MSDSHFSNLSTNDDDGESSSPLGWLKFRRKSKSDNNVRDAIEELLDGSDEDTTTSSSGFETNLDSQERTLIANVLSLSKLCAVDVMIPRADIVAVDINTGHEEIITLLGEKPYNRIPVYRETLDDIVGCITVKDILKCLAQGKKIVIPDIMREVMIVSPAIPVLDLMLEMRNSKKHLAMVIDEFGGIDGLVAVGDLVEAIVGEMNDEHDDDNATVIVERADGSLIVDARLYVEDIEAIYGKILNDDEREDIDTMGGLALSCASHLPTRGEIVVHPGSGIEMEILDADPRRVKRLCVSNLPTKIITDNS